MQVPVKTGSTFERALHASYSMRRISFVDRDRGWDVCTICQPTASAFW
jgi:hypothetical protein